MNKRAAILVALAALGVVLGRLAVRAALNALLGGTLFWATSYGAGADESQGVCPHWRGTLFLGLVAGVASKFAIGPAWKNKYQVDWDDSVGRKVSDIPYGDGEANKLDLYLPADASREGYGLVVYLHAGGFTSGDKADDASMLQ